MPRLRNVAAAWDSLRILPALSASMHKGQSGRVLVVGGCFEYTGAPYFAASAALRCGADLAYVACTPEAAVPIKSYSPELIVHPVLDGSSPIESLGRVTELISRVHAVAIGSGLGRSEFAGEVTKAVLSECAAQKKTLVIDGDALFFLSESPEILPDSLPSGLATANAKEFERLCETFLKEIPCPIGSSSTEEEEEAAFSQLRSLSAKLSGMSILRKGGSDIVFASRDAAAVNDPEDVEWVVNAPSSLRRCGGQGDILCGASAAFLARSSCSPACCVAAACTLTRSSAVRAFAELGRSSTASDMLHYVPKVMLDMFPSA